MGLVKVMRCRAKGGRACVSHDETAYAVRALSKHSPASVTTMSWLCVMGGFMPSSDRGHSEVLNISEERRVEKGLAGRSNIGVCGGGAAAAALAGDRVCLGPACSCTVEREWRAASVASEVGSRRANGENGGLPVRQCSRQGPIGLLESRRVREVQKSFAMARGVKRRRGDGMEWDGDGDGARLLLVWGRQVRCEE